MNIKLLAEHHLKFLILIRGCTARPSLHMSKCHIVRNPMSRLIFGHRGEKTCHRRFANNTGADQPAHLRSLVSAFVICLLESNISRLAKSEIQFYS